MVAIFHILEKEVKWRRERGLPEGFEGMTKYKPLVAIGAEEPLHDRVENADYFRGSTSNIPDGARDSLPLRTDGIDGLGGIHTSAGFPFL